MCWSWIDPSKMSRSPDSLRSVIILRSKPRMTCCSNCSIGISACRIFPRNVWNPISSSFSSDARRFAHRFRFKYRLFSPLSCIQASRSRSQASKKLSFVTHLRALSGVTDRFLVKSIHLLFMFSITFLGSCSIVPDC